MSTQAQADRFYESANQLYKKYGADKYSSFAAWWDDQMKKIQSRGEYKTGMSSLEIVNSNRKAEGLVPIAPDGSVPSSAPVATVHKDMNSDFTIYGMNGYVVGAVAVLAMGLLLFHGTKLFAKKQ